MTGEYKYTNNDLYLTDHQRKFYEDNGYLIIRNLFDDNILSLFEERFIDIANGRIQPDKYMVLMKDIALYKSGKKGENMYYKLNDFLHDDIFYKYVSYKKMVDILDSIIGPNITAFHSMIINKPPDAASDNSRHPLHQDGHYFPFGPADKIVASWTALQRIDERNGCLFGVPGTHKGPLYPHTYPDNVKNPAFHGIHGMDHLPRVNFVMERGDTVFFHPHLLHGSGPNNTKGFRRAISAHFGDTNCEFFDVTGTRHQDVSNEIVQIFSKKGVNLSVHDVWRYKSRLIKGRPGNFQKMSNKM